MPEDEVRCSRCGAPFPPEECLACISGRIMGDSCTDSYYWCAACSVYTVHFERDAFAGPQTARISEPIGKEEGERRLAIIRSCPDLPDERCRCDAHRAYFGDWLD